MYNHVEMALLYILYIAEEEVIECLTNSKMYLRMPLLIKHASCPSQYYK